MNILYIALALGAVTAVDHAGPVAQTVTADNEDSKMRPRIIVKGEGTFQCGPGNALFAADSMRVAGSPIADALDRLGKRLHLATAVGLPMNGTPPTPYLLIGCASDNPILQRLKADWKQKLPQEGLGPEGYLVDVDPKRVLLTADGLPGLLHGITRLLEQVTDSATSIPSIKIADWPSMKWRGIHTLVNSRASMPSLERLITEVLPGLRMNQLIMEINYNFAYKSHPELVQPGALTAEDCRRLSNLAKRNFIRIVPMINCLGHQSWAKTTFALLKTHPEFDETPNAPADNAGLYCRSWCPSNPDVNKVVCDLFDELIDAFQANAVHVGMDEVFILGQCPRCKGLDNAALFARAVNGLHLYLAGKRKVQVMMWADRLLDDSAMKYGEWEASANGTAPALQKISKDIVLCDWHYETPDDFPSVRHLQNQGFQVWPAGWNRVENVKRLTTCALKNHGPRMLGYLATTWTSPDAIVRAVTGAGTTRRGKEGTDLPVAIRLGAKMAWEGTIGDE